MLRKLLSDCRSLKQGRGIIRKVRALGVADALSIFKMKEVPHGNKLRRNWLLV
jgi:hypothetical protein